MHIIYRAGFAMNTLNIHPSGLGVMPHHIQGTRAPREPARLAHLRPNEDK